jgi:hypothetical protein
MDVGIAKHNPVLDYFELLLHFCTATFENYRFLAQISAVLLCINKRLYVRIVINPTESFRKVVENHSSPLMVIVVFQSSDHIQPPLEQPDQWVVLLPIGLRFQNPLPLLP